MHRLWILLLLLGSPIVQSQTLRVGDGTVAPGGSVTIPASFVAGGGVVDFLIRFTYPTAVFDTTVMAVNGGVCARDEMAGTVNVLPPASVTPQASNTYCQITFTAVPGAPLATYPLTIQGNSECFDGQAEPVNCTFDHGSITVQNIVGPTLAYAPMTGQTVSFTGPIVTGESATATIMVTPGGGSGGGTSMLAGCGITGGTGLTVTTTLPLTFGPGNGAQPLALRCTAGASAQNASLMCTETVAGAGSAQRGWPLFCPAGVGQEVFFNGFEALPQAEVRPGP